MGTATTWNSVMKGALSIPGVKVDRASFLRSELSKFNKDVDWANTTPPEVVSKEVLDTLAKHTINNHTLKTTTISTLSGIPGGLAMFGTIPADMVQFYANFLILSQKLAYIYGWPDLREKDNTLGEGAQAVLTMFFGVAFGVEGANAAIKKLGEEAAKHWMKKLPRMALTKTWWYPVLKKVLAWLGIKITKDSAGKAAGKIIPVLGGVISGGITYATFKPMAKKLRNVLAETDLAINRDGHE